MIETAQHFQQAGGAFAANGEHGGEVWAPAEFLADFCLCAFVFGQGWIDRNADQPDLVGLHAAGDGRIQHHIRRHNKLVAGVVEPHPMHTDEIGDDGDERWFAAVQAKQCAERRLIQRICAYYCVGVIFVQRVAQGLIQH